MAEKNHTAPKAKDEFTIGRDEYEDLAQDLRIVTAHADILGTLAATGDVEGLFKNTLSTMTLNMAVQLQDIGKKLDAACQMKGQEQETSHE